MLCQPGIWGCGGKLLPKSLPGTVYYTFQHCNVHIHDPCAPCRSYFRNNWECSVLLGCLSHCRLIRTHHVPLENTLPLSNNLFFSPFITKASLLRRRTHALPVVRVPHKGLGGNVLLILLPYLKKNRALRSVAAPELRLLPPVPPVAPLPTTQTASPFSSEVRPVSINPAKPHPTGPPSPLVEPVELHTPPIKRF